MSVDEPVWQVTVQTDVGVGDVIEIRVDADEVPPGAVHYIGADGRANLVTVVVESVCPGDRVPWDADHDGPVDRTRRLVVRAAWPDDVAGDARYDYLGQAAGSA